MTRDGGKEEELRGSKRSPIYDSIVHLEASTGISGGVLGSTFIKTREQERPDHQFHSNRLRMRNLGRYEDGVMESWFAASKQRSSQSLTATLVRCLST